MHRIQVGATREERLQVTDENAIKFLGLDGARVLSTPHMIGYMERTSRNLALPMLEDGYDTVGTHVNVSHIAAAPMGIQMRFTAEITGFTEKRVQFRVEAWDEKEKIGEGTHERGIINVARFASRMAAKL
jgi:predicted thioesterase